MKFSYSNSMDKEYYAQPADPLSIEEPLTTSEGVVGVNDIGRSATEGRAGGGTFLDSVKAAIFEGAASVELAAQAEGTEPFTGIEAYGHMARQDLKELAKANEITFTSVHTPSNVVGNVSGLGRDGFSPANRENAVNEIKKAIEFAADVGAGAIVVHTGEFARPMIGQRGSGWREGGGEDGTELFREYVEESGRGILHLVDDRTGQIIDQVRRNQIVYRPDWNKASKDDWFTDKLSGERIPIHKDDYLDVEGRPLNPHDPSNVTERVAIFDPDKKTFKVQAWTWQDFEEEAKKQREFTKKPVTPEEVFIRATLEAQMAQQKGWQYWHTQRYTAEQRELTALGQALGHYKDIEKNLGEAEAWRLMRTKPISQLDGLVPGEQKKPSELITERIKDLQKSLYQMKEAGFSYAQQVEELQLRMKHIKPISQYAMEQSKKSLAEAGIYAYQQTKEKKTEKNIFVAPENIFPQMGFGSHPDELIRLVQESRNKMVEYLTADKIKDPHEIREVTHKNGETAQELKEVDNPYKVPGMTEKEAKKIAADHIKATLDTQHLGMWWRHFEPRPGETEEATKKRFANWYQEQVEKMNKANILGHIHAVDGFGRGHVHDVIGEGFQVGGVNPTISAIEYLKKNNFKGTIISEAYGGVGRGQLTRTWTNLGSPAYGANIGSMRPGSTRRWADVYHSYFGYTRTPNFIFGSYSPSEEFKLWSTVPME